MKQAVPAEGADDKPLRVHNGTFTVDSQGDGHYTLKLHTVVKGKLAGKRIISLLVGPDNTADYKGVAFWDDEAGVVRVWERFKGKESRMRIDASNWQVHGWSTYERKLSIWCSLAINGDGKDGAPHQSYWAGEGYTLLLEGRCVVCNRKLTNPESIQGGVGPTCRSRT